MTASDAADDSDSDADVDMTLDDLESEEEEEEGELDDMLHLQEQPKQRFMPSKNALVAGTWECMIWGKNLSIVTWLCLTWREHELLQAHSRYMHHCICYLVWGWRATVLLRRLQSTETN